MIKILKDTRAIIDLGWTQRYYVQGGCHCLVGAIHKAMGIPTYRRDVALHVYNFVAELLPVRYQNAHDTLTGFNDRSSKEEVLALLDKAIECASN